MPYCPNCRGEYRSDIVTCAHCEVPLVAELPETPPETTHEGARYYIEERTPKILFQSVLETCRELRDYLLANDIPAMIAETEENGATDVPSVYQRFDVLVADEDGERVRAALSGRYKDLLENEGVELDEQSVEVVKGEEVDCPACGSRFVLEGDECPECGLFLGEPEF